MRRASSRRTRSLVSAAPILAAGAVAGLFAWLLVPGSPLLAALIWLVGDAAPTQAAWPSTARASSGPPALRVAVGAMISPERTHSAYGRLFATLAAGERRPLDLVQRRTYREVNGLLERGEVDVAWICTGAWPELRRSRAARLLAVPVVGGRVTYSAVLLAGPSTQAKTLLELRGARFAYTDPVSLTGCAYPRRRLAEQGFDAQGFFGATFYTHGHDLAIESVRAGFADAASVDGLVFNYLAAKAPADVAGLRVLETSPPFPIPPLVVPSGTPAYYAEALRRALLVFGAAPEERRILNELLVDGFAEPDGEAYDRIG